MATLQAAGIAAGVVQTVEDGFTRDPHVRARGFFEAIDHARKGTVVATGIPLGLTGTPGRTPGAGAAIGADNAYVFGTLLGLSSAEIDAVPHRRCDRGGRADRAGLIGQWRVASPVGRKCLMNTRVTKMLGIDFPIFAFTHCRDVVAAVTNAGGLGVLGAVAHTPEQLDVDLKWIREQTKGRPFGVDLLIPRKYAGSETGRHRRSAPEDDDSRRAPRVARRSCSSATTCRRCRRPQTAPRERARHGRACASIPKSMAPLIDVAFDNKVGLPRVGARHAAEVARRPLPRGRHSGGRARRPPRPRGRAQGGRRATSSSRRAPRAAGTPARSPRWC